MISAIAGHEAGHCVAALATGLAAVDFVTLDPPETHFTGCGAWLHGGRASSRQTKLPDRARWRMATVTLLAGVCAEARHTGEPFRIVFKRNSMDRRMALAFLDGLTSDPDARDELRRDLLLETRRLVERHWDAILRVARALQIHRRLYGFELERLLVRRALR